MESKIDKLNDDEFIDLVKSCLNISEVLFKLGYSTKGNSWGYTKVKNRMIELNIDGSIFRGKDISAIKGFTKKVNEEDLFDSNSKHQRRVLRTHIIKNRLLPYKCAICGITEWQGKPISLELDHINGINNDNRLENLRFLCPNCHSQTPTYGSKNQSKKVINYNITEELKETIINEYLKEKNASKVCTNLGLNRNAVTLVLKEAGYLKKNQKYVIQYDKDYNELRRFGCIAECCNWLMENNLVKTKLISTCRATLLRNSGKLWHNYYFEVLE